MAILAKMTINIEYIYSILSINTQKTRTRLTIGPKKCLKGTILGPK